MHCALCCADWANCAAREVLIVGSIRLFVLKRAAVAARITGSPCALVASDALIARRPQGPLPRADSLAAMPAINGCRTTAGGRRGARARPDRTDLAARTCALGTAHSSLAKAKNGPTTEFAAISSETPPTTRTMANSQQPSLGFLTVIEHPQQGFFGGYLLLNRLARPLEFHCTAPLKPNRAQEILYGPTLHDYLFGEQIGKTLVARGSHRPSLICTDCPPVMSLRELIDAPVVLLLPSENGEACEAVSAESKPSGSAGESASAGATRWRIDQAHSNRRWHVFAWEGRRLAAASKEDEQTLIAQADGLLHGFDLAEPFGRIRAAIEEARQAVRPT